MPRPRFSPTDPEALQLRRAHHAHPRRRRILWGMMLACFGVLLLMYWLGRNITVAEGIPTLYVRPLGDSLFLVGQDTTLYARLASSLIARTQPSRQARRPIQVVVLLPAHQPAGAHEDLLRIVSALGVSFRVEIAR